MILYIFKI